MASLVRLTNISSNIFTKSFHPTLVSASRFLTIDSAHQSYTIMPKDANLIDVSWVRNLFPKISSFSLDMDIYELSGRRSLKICVPDEGSVDLLVPGLQNYKKKWPFPKLKALILGRKKRKERFFSGIELGDKTCSKEMIMNDGRFNVTLPNEQDQFKIDHNIIMANIMTNMINSFRDINTKHSSPYYDMFYDRSIVGEGFGHLLAMLPINSFSIYKDETTTGLSMNIHMPGREKIKLTTQGLRVYLYMPKLKRKHVKIYFDYNMLFIEGKTKKDHYITGIHLPKGINKIKHNIIKRQMKNGAFYAFLPCEKPGN